MGVLLRASTARHGSCRHLASRRRSQTEGVAAVRQVDPTPSRKVAWKSPPEGVDQSVLVEWTATAPLTPAKAPASHRPPQAATRLCPPPSAPLNPDPGHCVAGQGGDPTPRQRADGLFQATGPSVDPGYPGIGIHASVGPPSPNGTDDGAEASVHAANRSAQSPHQHIQE